MPRKSANGGPSKSELIRKYKAEKPSRGPSEIATLMQQNDGVATTAQFVSTVLSQDKRRKTKGTALGRRGRPRKTEGAAAPAAAAPAKAAKVAKTKVGKGRAPKGAVAAAAAGVGVNVDSLIKARKLVEEMGGVSQAKAAIDALSRIMG